MSRAPLSVTMPRRWVAVPGGWAAPGVHRSGVAPLLECRSEPFDAVLERWAALVDTADASREDYDLEDDDTFELAGHEVAYRRFGHTRSGVPVLSERWLWVVDGAGHQLLGTVARSEYEDYCDVFESVAETFDPDPASRSA
jgi:hypothetical protein